jgi:hypothetical protein
MGLSRSRITAGGSARGAGLGGPCSGRPRTGASGGRTSGPGVGRSLGSASSLEPASRGARATASASRCRAERARRRAWRTRMGRARRSSGLGCSAGRVRSGVAAADDRRLGRARSTCGPATADSRPVVGFLGRRPGRLAAAGVRVGASSGRVRVGCAQDRRAGCAGSAVMGRVERSRR